MARRYKSIKICVICKREFHPSRKEYESCSHKCGAKLRTLRGGKTGYNKQEVRCEYCDKRYLVSPKKLKINKCQYCSRECYWLHQKQTLRGKMNPNYKTGGIKIECLTCKEEIVTYHKNKKYCSQKCVKRIDLKKRGTRYEWKARKELEFEGYTVVRSAGSRGVSDLIAFNSHVLRLIQVKVTKNLTTDSLRLFKKDVKQLRELIAPVFATKELWVYRDRVKRPIITKL